MTRQSQLSGSLVCHIYGSVSEDEVVDEEIEEMISEVEPKERPDRLKKAVCEQQHTVELDTTQSSLCLIWTSLEPNWVVIRWNIEETVLRLVVISP